VKDRLPSVLPKWLRKWAEACRNRGKSDLDSPWSQAQGQIDTLWRILSNPKFALGLKRLRTHKITKTAIVEFLFFACNVHKQYSSKKDFLNYSQQIEESDRLANQSRKLAELISSFSDYIPISPSAKYLGKRVAAGNPPHFSRARFGLRMVKYQVEPGQTLPQLLEAFADDIQEGFQFLNNRKDGPKYEAGKFALSNALVDFLARQIYRISGKPDHALIADMVSDMLGEDVSASRVRKRWEVRKIRL
jgi:hypothetical protein